MNIFLCDIGGTFNCFNYENRHRDLKQFSNNLKQLMNYNSLNNLYFSFITADDIDFLKPYLNEIKKYLENTSIKLGPQFSQNSILTNNSELPIQVKNKIDHIINILRNKDINTIFFADDMKMNHKILEEIISRHYPQIELIHFMPGNNINLENAFSNQSKGLESLNICIEKYLNQGKTKAIGQL